MRPHLLTFLLFAGPVAALEIAPGDTAWLDQRLRPEWIQTSLASTLDQIARISEREVVRSKGLQAMERDHLVTLVAHERVTLREALVWMEEANQLHFTAEPLVLRVATLRDRRNARRRFVDLQLTDYGAGFFGHDHFLPQLGFGRNPAQDGGFSLFAGGEEAVLSDVEPEDMLELMRSAFTDEMAQGESHALRSYLWVTPEEEAAVRSVLEEQFRLQTAHQAWRITFGTHATGPLTPGLMSQQEAATVTAELAERRVVAISGLLGQCVVGGELGEKVRRSTADVVNYRLDPVAETMVTGIGVAVRAFRGQESIHLNYSLTWLTPKASSRAEVRHVGQATRRSAAATTKPKTEDNAGDTTVTIEEEPGNAGERMYVDLDAIWTWAPHGTVVLGADQALVLVAPRDGQWAIIVIEVLP